VGGEAREAKRREIDGGGESGRERREGGKEKRGESEWERRVMLSLQETLLGCKS